MGSFPPVGGPRLVSGRIPQESGAKSTKASIRWLVLRPFQRWSVESRPTPDVHPAVAHGEDPAVAGHDVALGVADVEVRLNEGIVVALRL